MKVTLVEYENIATGDKYFGYPIKDATIKEIDGIKYVEVINNLNNPKQFFIKADNLKKVGNVTIKGK